MEPNPNRSTSDNPPPVVGRSPDRLTSATEGLNTDGNKSCITPPRGGRFRWDFLLLWFPLCLIHGAAAAWLATLVEAYRAPLIIFPLVIGAVLGVTGVGLARSVRVGHRPTILLGAVIAVTTVVVGQHYVHFHQAHADVQKDADTYRLAKAVFGNEVLGTSPIPPDSLATFLQWRAARGMDLVGTHLTGTSVWLVWAFDGLLILGATLLPVIASLGRPYCDRCATWFRTTRAGPLEPAVARAMAGSLDIELPREMTAVRYRLIACQNACGPVSVELSWATSGAKMTSALRWIDAKRRAEIMEPLDRMEPPDSVESSDKGTTD